MAATTEEQIITLASQAGQLAGQGRLQEARNLLTPALSQMPPHPHLWHNFAQILTDMGETADAERWFYEIIQRWPQFLPSYMTLVAIRKKRLGARPDPVAVNEVARLLNNQGNAIQTTGDHASACACYREALALDPGYANGWANLSNSLRIMGQVTEAETTARKALAIDRQHVGAWNNLGCALLDLGRNREADRCFDEVLKIRPNYPEAKHNAGGGRLFNLLFLESLSNDQIFQEHQRYGQKFVDQLGPRPKSQERIEGKLRIGFFSADFRSHAMAMFVSPMLEHLDRDQFEVFCYASQTQNDHVTRFVQSLPLTWREIISLSDQAAADLIRNDHLDLLVDLNGHTDGQRMEMLALRPAPCIATWLGYMATTGHPVIDYRITDRWTDPEPESAGAHTEALAYLKGSQFTFRPEPKAPAVQPTPALKRGHITFGSLNNVRKLSVATIRTWAEILERVPGSRLILQAKLFVDPGTTGYFRGLFDAFGIDIERIDMHAYSHNSQHMNTYKDIDIALDPFPYNGGATTCDALWMGVPVVALAGNRSVGRMGVSILNNLGRPEWIAASKQAYADIAVNLASDVNLLNEIRLGMRDQLATSRLRDEAGFARDFGATLRALVMKG